MIAGAGLLSLYCILLAAAAIQDLRTLTIPNFLVLGVLAASILLLLFVRDAAWLHHLASFAIVLLFGFALFAIGWMGGGDAKLAAAAAVLFSLRELAWFAFAVTASGVVLVIVMMLSGRLNRKAASDSSAGLQSRKVVPYGVAIAAGAAMVALFVVTPELNSLSLR